MDSDADDGGGEDDLDDDSFSIRDNSVLVAISTYGILAFMQQMLDEALPLFMKQAIVHPWGHGGGGGDGSGSGGEGDDSIFGGLGYSEADIGSVLAVGGISTLTMALFVVPKLERRFGALKIYRWGLQGILPIVSFTWLVGSFWDHLSTWLGWGIMCLVVLLKNTFLSLSFSGSFVMISNSAAAEHLGTVNGVGQTLASFSRATGPAACGLLWSLGTTLDFLPLTFIEWFLRIQISFESTAVAG